MSSWNNWDRIEGVLFGNSGGEGEKGDGSGEGEGVGGDGEGVADSGGEGAGYVKGSGFATKRVQP